MADGKRLNCSQCAAFCCKMAGQVEVTLSDVRRLASHLGLSTSEFDEKHIVRAKRGGRRLIKTEDETCQFLGDDRTCTVYRARPANCRGYVCWDQDDKTVYGFASMAQLSVQTLRRLDRKARNGN